MNISQNTPLPLGKEEPFFLNFEVMDFNPTRFTILFHKINSFKCKIIQLKIMSKLLCVAISLSFYKN